MTSMDDREKAFENKYAHDQALEFKAVARRMSVSQNTAKEYLDRVRAKYLATGRAARTKAELQAAAREDGLLHDEE